MAVAWAFPISLVGGVALLPFSSEAVPGLVALVWGLSLALFLGFPLYERWLTPAGERIGFVCFDFGRAGLPLLAWLLFLAVVLWAVAYDTIYAMVDRADDLRIGVKSTAILFGQADRLFVGAIQLSVVALLIMVGKQAQLGLAYYAGLGVATLLVVYQQYLIRERNPDACFAAFLNNNWFGAAIYAGIVLDFLQQR